MTKLSKKIKEVTEEVSTFVEPEPKRLTSLEFERLERSRVLKELRAKDQECLKLKQQAVTDRRRMLELTARCYDLDDKLLFDELAALTSKARQEREAHDAMLAEIRERLGIKERFGYHPDTLEVFEDEKS